MMHTYKQKSIVLLIAISLLPLLSNAQNKQYIDLWGGAGYSRLHHGIENSKAPGRAGFNLGAGYEYNLNRFMLKAGAEFLYFGSKTRLDNYKEDYTFLYDDHMGTTSYMDYHYNFQEYAEKHSIGYINIPLMFGMKFDRYYAMLGAKAGLNLISSRKTDAVVQTTVTEPMAIDDFVDIYEPVPFKKSGRLNLGLNIAASAEFGVTLDEWLPRGMTSLNNRNRTPLSYRAGVFVDYGLINLNKSSTNRNLLALPKDNMPLDIDMNDLASSRLAQNKRFGSLYTGIKLAVLFQVSKERKKPVPRTQQLPFMFYARVTDAETNHTVDAEVTLRSSAGSRQVFKKKTGSGGMVNHELRKGRYGISVTAEGYLNYKKTFTHSKADTLLIALQRIPSFAVHVTDVETKQNLAAEVTISTAADNKEIYKGQTEAGTGLMTCELKAGRYQVNVTSEGYIYHQEIINHSTSDVTRIALQPIKKDVKVVLHNLFFELNKADIMPESEPALEDLYQFLVKNPEVSIHIAGHTDNTGSASYNKTLSENRAKAVYNAIIEKGIDAARLTFEGKGAGEPVAPNDTEEGRAENRRVEFVIK